MKKIIPLSILLLSLFASCNSDAPQPYDNSDPGKYIVKGEIVPGNVDLQVLSRYSTGLADATYTLGSMERYYKSGSTNGKWKKVGDDLDGFDGFDPSKIVIKGGNCWRKMKSFYSAYGPTDFSVALDLIYRAKHESYDVLISENLQLDEAGKTLLIGKAEYGLLYADDNSMVISRESKSVGAEDKDWIEIASFKLSAPFETQGTPMIFETATEAYDWIIALFREYFGESVDRNKFYGGSVILDKPMFGVEDLIEERDRIVMYD